jgi:hypothetical protein
VGVGQDKFPERRPLALAHRGPESARKAEKVGVEDEGGLGAPDDRRVRDRIGVAVVGDDMGPETAKATRRVRPEGPAMLNHRPMPLQPVER